MKPSIFHEISGSYQNHPERRRKNEPKAPDGELVKPKFLRTGRAKQLWEHYAAHCSAMGTIKAGDEPELATWCVLQAKFEHDPDNFPASMIAQKRTYAERLGILGEWSRAKLSTNGEKSADTDESRKESYFDDARPGNSLRN